jgi:isoquinoline 1-oxidoreductase beta subunit
VEQVIAIPALAADKPAEYRALGGVAVIGSNTWSVMQGRDRLKIEWDDGPFAGHDSKTYDETLKQAARAGGTLIRQRGDIDAALAGAAKLVEAEYFVPYLAHATMEPLVAIVDATADPVRVIAPVQDPNAVRQYVAETLGIDISGVTCEVTLLGGGFGRKSQCDFACEAAFLSKAVGAPVRVQWSREDDMRHGYYHAASAQIIKAGLDAQGKVVGWKHGVAAPSIVGLWNPAQRELVAFEAGLGLQDLPFNTIPNLYLESGSVDVMIRIGWLRSVNNIQHAFAVHSFADELAVAAGRDPLEFLLELIGDAEVMDLTQDGVAEPWNYGDGVAGEWQIQPVRLANALRTVAKQAGYGRELSKGQAFGLAAHRSFQSYVATCVLVTVADDGSISVPRVDVAVDCGRYVNPDGVRKQMEGATIFGHSIARHNAITTSGGKVDQGNFDDYPVTRMADSPAVINVHLVEDYVHLPPCGVGEPGVPPYAPALANAIFAATGQRFRSLPIKGNVKPV